MTMKIGKLNGGMNMPLYNRLKEYRAKISVNQHEMGKLVGVSRQTISSLENGRYNPSIELAYKLSKYFGMTIEEVFIFEEAEK